MSPKTRKERPTFQYRGAQAFNWLQIGSKEAGPKIAALFSIVESCRKLSIPVRKYLADVLPGMADRSIQSLAEITPAAYTAKLAKVA